MVILEPGNAAYNMVHPHNANTNSKNVRLMQYIKHDPNLFVTYSKLRVPCNPMERFLNMPRRHFKNTYEYVSFITAEANEFVTASIPRL